MAGLLDLFSGRSSDIYGGALTPEQRGGLGNIGLLALAGKLGQLAGPSFSPVPDFGAAIGQAAGAYGASQEGAGTAALNAILTAQRGRKLEQELDYYKQLGPILGKLGGDWPGAGGGAGGGEGSGSTGGGAAVPAGAGGGGADPSETDIIGRESGGKPYVGYGGVDLSNKPLNEFGFPIWEGRMGPAGISHAAGLYQFQPGTWAAYAGPLGIKDFSPESQRKVYLAARAAEGARPWAASAGGGGGRAAAPTAAAPDAVRVPYNYGAPGGGLLNLPQVPNAARDYFGGTTGAPAAINPDTGLPFSVGGSAVGPKAPLAAGIPRGPAGDIGPAGPQGEVVVPMPPRPAPPPLAIPDLPPQAAAALAQAMPGLLMPGGGLLPRGAGAIPGMPPAVAPADAMPSDDPRLQLGPLAPTPAPAAAAPAAPGPGLLSPSALPGTAAALPRGANPAYDAYLRNLSLAGTLAEGAGLKNVFAPMIDALTKSPSYQAELERAKARVGVEFAGPKAEAEKAVELRYAGAIAAAVANGQLPSQLVLHSFDAQNAVKAALAAKGLVGEFDAGGNLTYQSRTPGADIADTAEATAKGRGEGQNVLVPALRQGPNGPYEVQIPRTQYIDELNRGTVSPAPGTPPGLGTPGPAGNAAAPGGAAAPGAAPVGALVGKPFQTPGEVKYAETASTQDAALRQQAIAARNSLPLLDDAKEQLTGAGIFSGPAANLNMTLAQLATTAGWSSEKLVNTQTYIQQAGARAAEVLRSGTYGTGTAIGATDLRAADKLANGDITQDIRTIQRIMDLAERKAMRDIDTFNAIAQKRDPTTAISHPPRWTGRYNDEGKRIDRFPDGSLHVRE